MEKLEYVAEEAEAREDQLDSLLASKLKINPMPLQEHHEKKETVKELREADDDNDDQDFKDSRDNEDEDHPKSHDNNVDDEEVDDGDFLRQLDQRLRSRQPLRTQLLQQQIYKELTHNQTSYLHLHYTEFAPRNVNAVDRIARQHRKETVLHHSVSVNNQDFIASEETWKGREERMMREWRESEAEAQRQLEEEERERMHRLTSFLRPHHNSFLTPWSFPGARRTETGCYLFEPASFFHHQPSN